MHCCLLGISELVSNLGFLSKVRCSSESSNSVKSVDETIETRVSTTVRRCDRDGTSSCTVVHIDNLTAYPSLVSTTRKRRVLDMHRSARVASVASKSACGQQPLLRVSCGNIIVDETIETSNTSGQWSSVHDIVLVTGSYQLSIERLNSWEHGYQKAHCCVTRQKWLRADLSFTLDSGRQNSRVFHVLGDSEELIVVLEHCWGAPIAPTTSGQVRILCERIGFDAACQPFSPLSVMMGSAGRCASMRADMPPSISELPCRGPRQATFRVAGKGPLSHWAVLVCFEDGAMYSCDLTAVDNAGNRFGQVAWRLNVVHSEASFLENYTFLEHATLSVRTSESELLWFCKTHPLNGEHYELRTQNCQVWLQILLVNGYGVSESMPWQGREVTDALCVAAAVSILAIAYARS